MPDLIVLKRRMDGKEMILTVNGKEYVMTMGEWSFIVSNPIAYPAPPSEVRR